MGDVCKPNARGVIFLITTGTVKIGGADYKRTVSDKYKIRKNGTDEIYEEAIDTLSARLTYTETETPLESGEN